MENSPSQPTRRAQQLCIASFVMIVGLAMCLASAQASIADDSGSIKLSMLSDMPGISSSNASYSLEGAVFGIYSDYQCTQEAARISTDDAGQAISGALPAGRYFLRQEQASPGFARTDHLYQADVSVSSSTLVAATETPKYSPVDVLLREVNAETGAQASLSGAKLGGARYVVQYYDGAYSAISSSPTRTWTFESDSTGEVPLSSEALVEGSPLFADAQGHAVLPLGHYSVFVENPPVGFLGAGDSYAFDIEGTGNEEYDETVAFSPVQVRLRAIRGDLAFRKLDENRNPLSGIPFLLSANAGSDGAQIEEHVIVTGENGDFSSDSARVLHSLNTNGNDAAVMSLPNGMFSIDEDKLDAHVGTWFSLDESGAVSQADDALGALPYGSYVLRELPCSANEGMNLVSVPFSVFKEGYVTTLDDIIDTVPFIESYAYDGKDRDKLVRPTGNTLICEMVSYRNLIPEKEYKLVTSVISRDTGEAVKDVSGSPVTHVTDFVPSDKEGRLRIELEIDSSKLAGRQLIVCEELRSNDGMCVSLLDIEDESHVIEVEPIVEAHALDALDKDKYIMGEDAVITEQVSYEGLKPGQAYVLNAVLNDKATGNAHRDAQGRVVEAASEFVPDSPSGTVELELPVDTTGVAGHDLVVFERLSDSDGKTIASHQDIENPEQTVKTVKISTSAVDKSDDDKVFDSKAASVTIKDTVKYANLDVGEQYELTGVLMDKETGSALSVGGTPISSSVPFVPKEVSGSVDVEISFDASSQTSEVLVAFETLTHDGKVIAKHEDLEDVAQTVTSGDFDAEPLATTGDGGTVLGASVSGKSAKTGDSIPRVLGIALIVVIILAGAIAIILHRRRNALEPIAKLGDWDE